MFFFNLPFLPLFLEIVPLEELAEPLTVSVGVHLLAPQLGQLYAFFEALGHVGAVPLEGGLQALPLVERQRLVAFVENDEVLALVPFLLVHLLDQAEEWVFGGVFVEVQVNLLFLLLALLLGRLDEQISQLDRASLL